MSLFPKPMAELRNAFALGRLAEGWLFGRADIEKVLAKERTAASPSEIRWAQFCDGEFLRAKIESGPTLFGVWLRNFATPTRIGSKRIDEWRVFEPVYLRFGENVFWGRDSGLFVSSASGHLRDVFSISLEAEGKMSLQPVVDGDGVLTSVAHKTLVDILLTEWIMLRPKWRQARELLCDAFAASIRRARVSAEVDFDEAIAVGLDGRSIIKADWVVVMNAGQATLFPGLVFHNNKIVLGKSRMIARHTVQGVESKMDLVLEFLREKDGEADWYFRWFDELCEDNRYGVMNHTTGVCSIFVVPSRLCPQPLPEGGVEI